MRIARRAWMSAIAACYAMCIPAPVSANIIYPLPGIQGQQLTIDSSQSYLTVTGTVFGINFVEQSPGSGTASLEGMLYLEDDASGNPRLNFGSYLKVQPNGIFEPSNSSGAFGSVIPNFWMGADAFVDTHNLAFGIQGTLSGSAGTFDAGKVEYQVDAGTAYIEIPGVLSQRNWYAGNLANISLGVGTLDEHPLQTTLTIPIEMRAISLLYYPGAEAEFHVTGQIVARSAVVPEASSLILIGAAVPAFLVTHFVRKRSRESSGSCRSMVGLLDEVLW